jgi:hypothetical protein
MAGPLWVLFHVGNGLLRAGDGVEVATEAEPLSLSIARARVLLSRLSVFSLLPCLVRARLWYLALSALAFGFLASCLV